MKVFFLGNYTQDLIIKELDTRLIKSGMKIEIYTAGFNQYQYEIINNNSLLYQTLPDIVFLSIDFNSLIEDLLSSKDSKNTIKEPVTKRISETLDLLKKLSIKLPNAAIFIDNFFLFRPIIMRSLEYNSSISISEFPHLANTLLLNQISELSNVKIIDVLSIIIEHGAKKLFDERLYYIAKCHWSFQGIIELSNIYLRYINAFLGIRKKCIIVDLDNTLWGGVIGDDGIENIELSSDGPGKAYYDFQKELLRLHSRGIMLAVSSKNTNEIAEDVINNHPSMILKKEHFLCLKINWNNKTQSIQEIAKELNIGLDSIVFIDDSPFERNLVSSNLPDVLVLEMPVEASEYPNFIRSVSVFDLLNLSNDDLIRNDSYKANKIRDNLKLETVNLVDFYYSLELSAQISLVSSSHLQRIAQLTQKTNQFNLRSIRYNELEIKEKFENSNFEIYQMSLSDKFGEYGIIACLILELQNKNAFIDTFLLSCRAFGRTAETALINFVIESLKNRDFDILEGEYIQTSKNSPCKNFFLDHDFELNKDEKWIITLSEYMKKQTPWITINP